MLALTHRWAHWRVAAGRRLLCLVVPTLPAALTACAQAPFDPRVGEPVAKSTSPLGSSSFVPPGYGCVWHDEFGGDQGLGQSPANLDTSSWSFQEIAVNSESEAYTTKQCLAFTNDWNYCVADGRLRIQGRNESINCDANKDGVEDNPSCAPNYGQAFLQTANYTSGRLVTKQKVHFSDGYIEFRVKLPQAARAGLPESGLWPAVWTLGENINQGPHREASVGRIVAKSTSWNGRRTGAPARWAGTPSGKARAAPTHVVHGRKAVTWRVAHARRSTASVSVR